MNYRHTEHQEAGICKEIQFFWAPRHNQTESTTSGAYATNKGIIETSVSVALITVLLYFQSHGARGTEIEKDAGIHG